MLEDFAKEFLTVIWNIISEINEKFSYHGLKFSVLLKKQEENYFLDLYVEYFGSTIRDKSNVFNKYKDILLNKINALETTDKNFGFDVENFNDIFTFYKVIKGEKDNYCFCRINVFDRLSYALKVLIESVGGEDE